MHPRYSAPAAERIFSDEERLKRWTDVSRDFMIARVAVLRVDAVERQDLLMEINALEPPTPEAVATREVSTGHDVVAFLSLLEQNLDKAKHLLHRGLTSSDVVDNAHFDALRTHADTMARLIGPLQREMGKWENQITHRAGRTHGQTAAPTSWNHQMRVYNSVLGDLFKDFSQAGRHKIIKSSGPVGLSLDGYDAARNTMNKRYLGSRIALSTQVIPRDHQVRWAALYLRLAGVLENLALLIRLGARAEIGEIREGAERVGSSAMPHKKNPIDSEKVCGLARVARGYFATIAEGSALWEDRDLTNSSLERVAVPDLAATVEHMLLTMIKVMRNLQLHPGAMADHVDVPATKSAFAQMHLMDRFKVGPVRASTLLREWVNFEGAGEIALGGLADRLGVPQREVEEWWLDVLKS